MKKLNIFTIIGVPTLFTIIMMSVPWEKWQGIEFNDLHAYIQSFTYNVPVMEDLPTGDNSFWKILYILTHEALWDVTVRSISEVTKNVRIALELLTAVILFTNSFIILNHTKSVWKVCFLINPLFVDFSLSQIRSALSFTLVLLATYLTLNRSKTSYTIAAFLLACACCIHTAGVIFLLIFCFSIMLSVNNLSTEDTLLNNNKIISLPRMLPRMNTVISRIIFVLLGVFIIVAMLSINREEILQSIEDRRAVYTMEPSTYKFASFSILLLAIHMVCKIDFWKDRFCVSTVMYNGIFVGLTIFKTYGSRFFEAAIPLLALSFGLLTIQYRMICLLAYIIYTSIMFLYWMQG